MTENAKADITYERLRAATVKRRKPIPSMSTKTKPVSVKEPLGGTRIRKRIRKGTTVPEVLVRANGEPRAAAGLKDQREDEELIGKLRAMLIAGDSYEAACQLTGIGMTTFARWMKEGRDARPGTLAKAFFDSMELASAQAEHHHIMCIRKCASAGDWRASAWWLERRRPSIYGRREVVSHTLDSGGKFESPQRSGALSDSEKRAALLNMLRLEGSSILKRNA